MNAVEIRIRAASGDKATVRIDDDTGDCTAVGTDSDEIARRCEDVNSQFKTGAVPGWVPALHYWLEWAERYGHTVQVDGGIPKVPQAPAGVVN